MIRAAKNATKTIPIVMTGSGGDPVEAGLIECLACPGGNVTGLTRLSERTRREAAGAARRSGFQSCPCRGPLRSRYSAQCNRCYKRFFRGGARAAVESSALGGTRCGRVREGIRYDEQAASG